MDNKNLFIELEKLLRMESTYCTEDGVLLKNAIVEAALALRPELIAKLLSHDGLKRNFFTEVEGVLVFDKVKFQKFVMNKRFLPDSYTSFKNKVGLTNEDGDFLSESREVVLSWPYKDCVLEGGQTKEDVKRNEVFWNEILAPDEINRLTEPKVLTNFKRYDVDGEHGVDSISMDDNLIIKGNNLLALHSLKRKYAGKVKLIYIDPPYNTGNDSFGYNDKFTRSSWLTFMQNRLLIAKQLLSEDGSIFIQCDENQNSYLRVLCDKIFGEDNLMNEIIWRYRTYVGQVKDYFPKKHDTIFWYKNINRPQFHLIYEDNIEETVDYKRWNKYIVDGNKIRYGNHPETDSRFEAYLKKYIKQYGIPQQGQVIYEVNGYIIDDVWEDIIALDPKNITERTEFTGGQKPEALLQRIIDSVTKTGDIVLDFHLGSGTTAAVAHKMGRRYIGIEQMDYIESITMKRLKKVIGGEQGGISQSVNWQGGGSFVYCELAKANQQFADDIEHASSSEELVTIWEQMQETGFLSWKVNPKEINANADDFTTLAIEDQKRFLIECLDKNLLYIPYSEIDNAEFGISENDKKINNQFYQTK